jgi:hypothetical protein
MHNAAEIGLRAIDLFSLQPILGELAQAEAERVLKRQGEKDRCLERLGFDGAGALAVDVEHRCSKETAQPGLAPLALTRSRVMGPVTVPATWAMDRIEDSYQSSWLFMPTELKPSWQGSLRPAPGHAQVDLRELGAAGYQFDPNEMWNLFVVGAYTAFERCEELKATLGWHYSCSSDEAEVKAQLGLLRHNFEARGCGAKSLEVKSCAP